MPSMSNVVSIGAGANTFPPPRPFQQRALADLHQGFSEHRNQLLMAPTGAGKTYIALRAAQLALRRGRRVLFLCDRTSLVEQTSAVADSYGLDHGIIQGSHARTSGSKPFQIATAQTLNVRRWPECDLLIVDEAHTRYKVWTDKATSGDSWVIGLSATPFADGLGSVFSRLVCPTTMHELTKEGVLVPMRVMTCQRIDMSGVQANTNEEWSDEAVQERGFAILGNVVSEWIAHGEGRKTIAFAATVAYCEALCKQFNEVGVMAAVFSYRTEANDRKALLEEFRKPDSSVRVLISVEALAKGFDVPDVQCVIDCRPLRKSFSTAMQMWGRGARSHPGKADFLLLDHSGNIQRFVEDFEDVYFNGLNSLDAGKLLDRRVRSERATVDEEKSCPECGYKPFHGRCLSCGHALPPKAVVHEPGVMKELILWKSLARSQTHLWAQLCAFARETPWIKKKEKYAKLKFRELTKGTWPPKRFRFDDTPPVEVGESLRGRLRHEHIKYQHRRSA
jgi:DNA repair protein RadD